MSLAPYRKKRKFKRTPEPKGKKSANKGPLRFVVQKHDATRTHYDFRIELDGTLKSWAVPKTPSLNPLDQRLAIRVEDHPLEYGKFEGVIPEGNYGAGAVIVWDRGTYQERHSEGRAQSEKALREGLLKGKVTLLLSGEKLQGEFALIRLKKKGKEKGDPWLLIKKRDEHAVYRRSEPDQGRSVKSGRLLSDFKPIPKPIPKASRSLPHRVRPQIAASVPELPTGKDWVIEPLFGGTRALAEIEPSRVTLHSSHLVSLDRKFPTLLAELRKLKGPLLLDGEITEGKDGPTYWISDLLYEKDKDLRPLALSKRRTRLEKLKLPSRTLSLVSWKERPRTAQIIAKYLPAPYRSGVQSTWQRQRSQSTFQEPPLTHLDKLFWPKEKITKGDLLEYHRRMAPYLIPHLKDRPLSLHRHPDGIEGKSFFHKDMSGYLPRRIRTFAVESRSSEKTVHYLVCDDLFSLLYVGNMGCIELNPWLSRTGSPDRPDYLVIDLDPDGNPFNEVVRVANEVHRVLESIKVKSFPKTSGASGLHIGVPLGAKYSYDEARDFAIAVAEVVHERLPKLTSLERSPARRRRLIYLDCFQNRRSQTLACAYTPRPIPGASVSTPLKWSEVKPGLDPKAFTLSTIQKRVARVGDLWKGVLGEAEDLPKALARLKKQS